MSSLSEFFSDKQILSIRESNSSYNIWEGSIRSGKTHASLWRFVHEANVGPDGDFAIITRTYDSFERNILPELQKILGNHVRYFRGKRQIFIKQRKCHVITADDASAEAKIRGCTLSAAYVDEITIIPENVFFMLLGRLSVDGAKLFGTTNPDSPYHWLRRWMDENVDVKAFKFTMDDNPSLSTSIKDLFKRQYKGLWYLRFIEGKWVQAEGAVYDFFDEKLHVVEFPGHHAIYHLVGVDYGTTNPCAFVLLGVNPHRYPNIWVEDEYYYDSRARQSQKTDGEYAGDLMKFVEGRNVKAIYVDPSAASFKAELLKVGFDNIHDAENEVNDGIRFVAKYLNQGTFKITRKCKHLIAEFQSYVWDEKSTKLGVDKPKKENDHCFEAGTLVATDFGKIPIERLKVGDFVLTSGGYKPILKTWKKQAETATYSVLGITYNCTDSHKFFTLNRGFVEVSDLLYSDIFIVNLESECTRQLSGVEQYISDIQELKTSLTETTIADGLKESGVDISIGMFGSSAMEKFHSDTVFITKTGTPPTMMLAISNWSSSKVIASIIGTILQKSKDGLLNISATKTGILQKIGTALRRVLSGTKSMGKTLGNSLFDRFIVNNAEPNIKRESYPSQDFVRINVSQNGVEVLVLMMRLKTALSVLRGLEETSMPRENSAQKVVPSKIRGKRDVYNLTVKDKHEFYANGILVANCLDALRYVLFSHFFNKDFDNLSSAQLDELYNQTRGIRTDLPPFFNQPNDSAPRVQGF
jgi:PBSX family phage terminase large subunit